MNMIGGALPSVPRPGIVDQIARLGQQRDAGVGVVIGDGLGRYADLDEGARHVLGNGLLLASDALDGEEAHQAVEGGGLIVGQHGHATLR